MNEPTACACYVPQQQSYLPVLSSHTATCPLTWQLQAPWQLVSAAAAPVASPGSLLGDAMVLVLLANGLMVPRALQAGELMWFTGTATVTLLTAAQAVMLALTRALAGSVHASVMAHGMARCAAGRAWHGASLVGGAHHPLCRVAGWPDL